MLFRDDCNHDDCSHDDSSRDSDLDGLPDGHPGRTNGGLDPPSRRGLSGHVANEATAAGGITPDTILTAVCTTTHLPGARAVGPSRATSSAHGQVRYQHAVSQSAERFRYTTASGFGRVTTQSCLGWWRGGGLRCRSGRRAATLG